MKYGRDPFHLWNCQHRSLRAAYERPGGVNTNRNIGYSFEHE
jgi:hypothetical protein